jgi:hypothetical protein
LDKFLVLVVVWFALTIMGVAAYWVVRLFLFLVRGIVLVVADDLRRITRPASRR